MATWRIAVLLLASALLPAGGAQAQESWALKCSALPSGTGPGLIEFCAGIAALSGNNGETAPDPQGALGHYKRAADLGFAEAQATLGAIYERGWQGITPDLANAVLWYGKAAAQGHAGAELNLGKLYAEGRGVPKDLDKARILIKASADQGFKPAQTALAQLDAPDAPPVPGADLFAKAVQVYQSGDHAGAALLLQQSAQMGHPIAMYQLGFMYENGDGVDRDPTLAAQWYMRAADTGDAAAQAAVGQLYEQGNQVAEDWETAVQWYMKSADQGNRMGMFRLGRAYQYGVGVQLNLDQALTWYDKAAALGDAQGAYFARYLRDNHGFDRSFYSDQEQALMGPYMMQPFMLHPPPIGRVFRNAEERLDYYRQWAAAANAHEQCMTAHATAQPGTTFTCPSPNPPN